MKKTYIAPEFKVEEVSIQHPMVTSGEFKFSTDDDNDYTDEANDQFVVD